MKNFLLETFSINVDRTEETNKVWKFYNLVNYSTIYNFTGEEREIETDRQTDIQTDRRTDGHTDRKSSAQVIKGFDKKALTFDFLFCSYLRFCTSDL